MCNTTASQGKSHVSRKPFGGRHLQKKSPACMATVWLSCILLAMSPSALPSLNQGLWTCILKHSRTMHTNRPENDPASMMMQMAHSSRRTPLGIIYRYVNTNIYIIYRFIYINHIQIDRYYIYNYSVFSTFSSPESHFPDLGINLG